MGRASPRGTVWSGVHGLLPPPTWQRRPRIVRWCEPTSCASTLARTRRHGSGRGRRRTSRGKLHVRMSRKHAAAWPDIPRTADVLRKACARSLRMIRRGNVIAIAVLSCAGLLLLTACSGSGSAKLGAVSPPAPSTTLAVKTYTLRGTYVQPAIKISAVKPLPGGKRDSFRGDSGTIWHGDLEGQTKFVMRGVVDVKTFASSAKVDEVFAGTVAGAGSGHLHFLETVTVDAGGTISLDARIVSGDGALSGLHGTMHFAGKSIPSTGKGDGTYTATFTSHAGESSALKGASAPVRARVRAQRRPTARSKVIAGAPEMNRPGADHAACSFTCVERSWQRVPHGSRRRVWRRRGRGASSPCRPRRTVPSRSARS